MAHADIDFALGTEGDHHRLPQQALVLFLDPVAALAALADGEQQLALGRQLLDRRLAGVGDPDIVLGIHRQAMGLFMETDHALGHFQHQLAAGIELEELAHTGGRAFEDP